MTEQAMKMATTGNENILVVDDVPANLQLLNYILSTEGFTVRPVLNGPAALKSAINFPPDLILLDISMPDMDGYEVCRKLKENPDLSDIPIIFLSCLDEVSDKVKAFQSGGVDYITKPFEPEEVLARVRTHITMSKLKVELKLKNGELERNNEQLRELEQLRERLAHMVAHDMRSPLSGIDGFFYLIQTQTTNPQIKEFAALGSLASDQLMEMVSSYLDVYRMESNKLELELADCNLVDLVTDAETRITPLLKEQTTESILPPTPCIIACDAKLLARVLRNLLDNAIKFSPKTGHIQLSLTSNDTHVRLSVQDQGAGVSAENHATIFEKFGQVKGVQNQAAHSTGLGLTFCKMVIERHGGTIGVDSDLGKGACFWFELPREQ